MSNEVHNYIRHAADVGVKLYVFSCTINLAAAGFVFSDLEFLNGKEVVAWAFVAFNVVSAGIYFSMPWTTAALVKELKEKNINYPNKTYGRVAWVFGFVFVVAALCWGAGVLSMKNIWPFA